MTLYETIHTDDNCLRFGGIRILCSNKLTSDVNPVMPIMGRKRIAGFRGILGVSRDGNSTRYAIGTRKHRRTVIVRTLSQMSFS